MSERLKRKAFLAIAAEVICLILLGIFLTRMQTNLSVSDQRKNTENKVHEMSSLLEEAQSESGQITASFDEIYKSKADSLAYMYRKQVSDEYTDEKLKEYSELLEVTNAMIVDRKGNVIARAQGTPAEFARSRYNQLRTVFDTGEVSDAFEVQNGDLLYRYYGARIDDEKMAVIEQDPEELNKLLDETSTWKAMLGNVSVGLNGYAFAVSAKDYTFLYHPQEDLVGKDALSAGIPVEELEDNNYTWLTINKEKFYCGITKQEDAYILCAVSEKEITASRGVTVAAILFAFFAVMTLVITYSVFTMKDREKSGKEVKGRKIFGRFSYDKVIGRKISTISVVGLIFILLITFYMQTLFALSRQSMGNIERVEEVEKTLKHYEKDVEETTEEYNERYLNKGRIASYIISARPELAEKDALIELSNVLDVEAVNVFDSSGVQTATSSPYTNFTISDDPENQSYEFNKLLLGADYIIQDAQPDETSGEYRQYIGVTLRDADGNADGFVQIGVTPSKLKETLSNMQLSKVLEKTKVGKKGFVFAVDKENKTFAYYPEEKLIGRSAAAHGMKKHQFRDEYRDYITIDNKTYYGSSLETDKNYIYVVVPASAMTSGRLPVTLACGAVSLVFLMIIFFMLTFTRKDAKGADAKRDAEGKSNFDIEMPDGSIRRTESAESRWGNMSVKWNEKTPEQQMSSVLKVILGVLAAAICIAVLMKDKLFGSNSIFLYILSGEWERGLNIFALTGCVMIICVAAIVTVLIQAVLRMLARTFGARGETICRLLRSFVKYFSVIAILYYSLALIGIDTKTLLASAGILTLVVGLGARTLVSDILAGLFIIFEGEFRVGDIVTIGDWRGTVLEIGIRTTKIEDPSNNVKVISNSEVSGVINMTRQYSYAWSDVGIEYGESLERVENILEKELPNIRKRLPNIIEGPFYKGVIELAQSSVIIRIMVLCTESDRVQMGRDLNREMKLIFDKYDINIPFPQVVINEPRIYKKATAWEKREADKFNESQKELAQGFVAEEKEE